MDRLKRAMLLRRWSTPLLGLALLVFIGLAVGHGFRKPASNPPDTAVDPPSVGVSAIATPPLPAKIAAVQTPDEQFAADMGKISQNLPPCEGAQSLPPNGQILSRVDPLPPSTPNGPGSGPQMTPSTTTSPAPAALRNPAQVVRRSAQLESLAQEVDRHTRRAFELAGRNAFFAARAEFLLALRLLAQGLDSEQQTDVHNEALTGALTAIRESEDFLPRGPRLEATSDVAGIIANHRTPVLKDALSRTTALEAVRMYLNYAQEQFTAAAGQEVAGSMALRGLGKLYVAMAAQPALHVAAAESKAMTFFQAALLVSPQNYLASNDLGCLLARGGRYADAKVVLEYATAIARQPECWHNLAVVYSELGMKDKASRAEALAQRGQPYPSAGPPDGRQLSASMVDWVAPERFGQRVVEQPQQSRQ